MEIPHEAPKLGPKLQKLEKQVSYFPAFGFFTFLTFFAI